MSLTASQRRYLRGLAHPLKPLVAVGSKGLTPGVIKELEQVLRDHELTKMRLPALEKADRDAMVEQICADSGAETVQRVGHVLTVFKRNLDTPRIALPR